ncbi:hypothetical protein BDF22DRAFT_740947 [Syncephalis plumigaleata]|nr:hypothetical protein BDF22DRAFT_740947 [Syncephalis plumigaleata]
MLKEISIAVEFFTRIFRLTPQTPQYDAFAAALSASLQDRYEGRWHPTLHSAHRAVTIFGGVADQVLLELVVWVDPGEVAFRIGERGQPSTLYKEGGLNDSDSDGAVRITAPGSVSTIPAPVATAAGVTSAKSSLSTALSPLGQAVMNASRNHAPMYNPIAAAAANMNAFSQQQQQQQQHFISSKQPHPSMFQPQHYYPQATQFRHPHHHHHHHQQQHHQAQPYVMMINTPVQHQRPRANSPTKSVVRYVEAR